IGEAQVRAYLTIAIQNCSSFDEGLSIRVNVVIDNKGQSPARSVKRAVAVVVVDEPIAVPQSAWALVPSDDTSTTVAMGQPIYVTRYSEPITHEHLIALRERKAALCIFVV